MISLDSRKFFKDMNNIIEYSVGFLEGTHSGKSKFMDNLGAKTIELLKDFIDANARINPEALHHVYEWSQTGSPAARLFDIKYTVSGVGLSINSTFRQSTSVKAGSTTPFYNKAEIMEKGIPVVIRPKNAKVLAFNVDGEEVFTSKSVSVMDPGGAAVQGAYERTFDSFFTNYFSQAFLESSGLKDYLSNPTIYKKNLPSALTRGKAAGVATGYKWITNAGVDL